MKSVRSQEQLQVSQLLPEPPCNPEDRDQYQFLAAPEEPQRRSEAPSHRTRRQRRLRRAIPQRRTREPRKNPVASPALRQRWRRKFAPAQNSPRQQPPPLGKPALMQLLAQVARIPPQLNPHGLPARRAQSLVCRAPAGSQEPVPRRTSAQLAFPLAHAMQQAGRAWPAS